MLLSASEQLRLGKRDDVSTRDFMNRCGETDQMNSSFSARGKKKSHTWHKNMTRQKVHPTSLARSRLTQSQSAPGLGSRPRVWAPRPEAWAPPGADTPRGPPAGGGRPCAPAPPGPRLPARPALRPQPASPARAAESLPGSSSLKLRGQGRSGPGLRGP